HENGKIYFYPYSSYGYYLNKEKHPFCDTDYIQSYFSKNNPQLNYKSFIERTDIDDPNVYRILIDPED
ncbi:MAG: hypothetical protein M1450_00665, partial [Patescibacteria group bacterium]|nr:hypothetical protein [Patescibacteria group bacterium]